MSDPRLDDSSSNPYAAPRTAVTDVYANTGETQPVHLFSARGRMGRLRYICWTSVFSLVASLLLIIVLGAIVLTSIGTGIFAVRSESGLSNLLDQINIAPVIIGGVLVVLIVVVWLVSLISLMIQRSHDIGWSGWSILILIAIMIGGMVVVAVLSAISTAIGIIAMFFVFLIPYVWYFKPGTPGANRFGPPPSPTPVVVQVFAWIFVAGMAIQFLVNIADVVSNAPNF